MGADASIYNMIRPQAPAQGPLEQYGAMMQLRAMGDASQLHGLQRKKLEDDMAEEGAYKGALARLAQMGDLSDHSKPLPSELYAVSPTRALALDKSRLEGAKTRGELKKLDLEAFSKSAQEARDALAGVADQPTYQQWQQAGAQRGWQVALKSPPTFNPEWQRQQIMTADKFIEQTTPKFEWKTDGEVEKLYKIIPATGLVEVVKDAPVITKKMTPEQADAAKRGWATLAETKRAHNLTDARERDVALQGSIAGARERGKEGAQAEMGLPGVVQGGERAVRLVDELLAHKGFRTTVGATLQPGARFVPGTDASDFQARFDEIKGGAFLQAFESLKGAGQITEIEGKKATDALNRMSLSQSEGEFRKAADEFKSVVAAGVAKAKQKAAGAPASRPANPMAPGGASVMAGSGGIKFLGFEKP